MYKEVLYVIDNNPYCKTYAKSIDIATIMISTNNTVHLDAI